jgi:hypothetical protein
VSLGVLRECAPGLVERGPLADAMEYVVNGFGLRGGVADCVRRADGNPEPSGGMKSPPFACGVGTIKVALNSEANALSERLGQSIEVANGGCGDRRDENPQPLGVSARELDGNACVCVARKVFLRRSRLPLGMKAMALRQNAAKICVPNVVLDEHDQGSERRLGAYRQIAPDDQTDALFCGLLVGTNDAVEPVTIRDGNGIVAKVPGSRNEFPR